MQSDNVFPTKRMSFEDVEVSVPYNGLQIIQDLGVRDYLKLPLDAGETLHAYTTVNAKSIQKTMGLIDIIKEHDEEFFNTKLKQLLEKQQEKERIANE